jgi:DNA mismatch endonuclease (patch repair protein)
MPYKFDTTEERSNLMKKIRSSGTKPEILIGKTLWHRGYRYRKHYNKIPGKPDFVFVKQKVVVFLDGEFWHGFNWDKKKDLLKSNRDYWIPKIERNMKRDQQNNELLSEMGWKVLRFWERQVIKNFDECIKNIESALRDDEKK